jgi:predicted esterase
VIAGVLSAACQTPSGEPSGSVSGAPGAAPSSAVSASAATSAAASPSAAPSASSKPPLPTGIEYHALVQDKVGFYAVLLPPGYEEVAQRDKRFPVVVILHGSGSTEVKHGKLADGFGREGAIYVLPRAPHAHEDTFIEGKEPGWTAWPSYPETWGKFDSPTFPQGELVGIDPTRLYVEWIRRCVEDARKRYRTDGRRVVVFGHSQGAAFAHYFALVHPELVKAYFAYAGYYDRPPKGFDVAMTFKARHVTPFIAHHEADATVKVAKAQSLIDYFREHGVVHTGLVLPGGNHRLSDRIKEEARRFIDVQSCRTSTAPCSR